jgi:hypothetical protein
MIKEELQQSVEAWKNSVEAQAFGESISVFGESTVAPSALIDKISTWAAAGTAAVAGLVITNIDKMASVYSLFEIKWMLYLLAMSIALALIQKILHSICESALKVSIEVRTRIPPILKKFRKSAAKIEQMSDAHGLGVNADLDFDMIVARYIELFPSWILIFRRSQFEKSASDTTYAQGLLMGYFAYQVLVAVLQYIAIFIFILLAAIYL